MGIVYSLYDALVSINVPDEKAKAVIDAMEREMMDKIVTKADLAHAQEILSRDIKGVELGLSHVRDSLAKDIQGCATKVEVAELARKLTTQMYLSVGSAAVLSCSVLGTLLVLLR